MKIQSDVYAIIFLTILLSVAMIVVSKKIDKTDPMAKPKGIVLPVLRGIQSVYNTVKTSDTVYSCFMGLYLYGKYHFSVRYFITDRKLQCHAVTCIYYLGTHSGYGIPVHGSQGIFPFLPGTSSGHVTDEYLR